MQKSRSVHYLQVPSNELLKKPNSSLLVQARRQGLNSSFNLPDSGIDSLKMNSISENAGHLGDFDAFGCNLRPSPALSNKRPTSMMISNEKDFLESSFSKNENISSHGQLTLDLIPDREPPRRHEFRSPVHFIDFAKNLIEGFRLYIDKYENIMRFYPENNTLRWRINLLQKKLTTVTKLLDDYQAILGPGYLDSATSPDVVRYQSNKKSMNRFSSLLSLFNVRQDHKFGSNNFLPETSRNSGSTGKAAAAAKNYGLPAQQQQQQHPQEDRLRRIEEQVGRLSGCFHLCADAVTGSTLGLSSKDYCVQIELQPLCQQQPSRMSLSGAGRRNSLLLPLEHPEGSSPSLTDSSTPFCWSFKLSANKTGFYASTSNVNASVTGYVPPNSTYALSETTHDLSPEPFTAFVATVFEERGRKLDLVFSETKAVNSFFSPYNLPLRINFTVLGVPFVNVHIFWIPLTTMDSDQLSSPESSLRIAGHFYRTADDHSDLNSVGSRRSQASNQDYNQTFSSTSFASSLETGEYSDVHVLPIESQSKFSERRKEKLEDGQPMTYQDVSSAESSVIYENAKEVSHFDESSLGHIVEQLREQLEYLSRTPCRYTQVLLATSDSLERLCEFMVSDENREDDPQIAVDSLSRTKNHETHSDKALEGLSQDPTEALCMLDTAVDFAQSAINNYLTEPPLTVGSDRRVQAQPSISSFNSFDDSAAALHTSMTSGWTELDDVIRWHLQNIRQLLSGLSSSPEIFGMLNDPSGGAGSNGSPHGTLKTSENFLPVHQDLTAMALQDQAEILVALAGVVNYYAETQNHCQTVSNTNCLDYGGTRSNSLLPKDFWRLVWGQEAESISRSRNSLHRLSAYSTQSTISLLLPRQKLLEYFFILCRDGCHFTDEDDVLQAAMEDLLDQMTDADITDHSWAYIPLTQLCLRLRPSTLVMAASTLKPSGIPNHAGRSPVFRPGSAQRQDLALFNILRYIRSQTRLQRQLRQHDEEAVYQTLETFLANARGAKRRQCGRISVNTFICIALNLINSEPSLTSLAADVIKELTRITSELSVIDSGSASMPFLRVAGPCHLFAKALNAFAQNLGTSRLPRERESRVDTSRTNSRLLPTPAFQNKRMGVGGAFSPISSTLLWGIQSRAAEEYRMASLAAYSVIFGSTGPAYNSGDAEINSRQQYQQRGPGRISETVMLLRGADTVSLHSGVYLLSVEDESPRVRSLALEASKTHRSNLGLSRAKFRSTNSIITE